MPHTKQHRAPIRYSLTPHERKDIAAYLRIRGRVTTREIHGLARRYGCAQKIIHEIADHGHVPITQLPKPSSTPRPAAPSSAPDPDPEHKPDDPDEIERDLETLSELEARLRKEYQLREEELLSEICSLEEQLNEQAEKREQNSIDQIDYAKRQVERTRQLRIATREDRETIESLKGECSASKRYNNRLKKKIDTLHEHNRWLNKELRASTEREKKLVLALEELLSETSETSPA